MTPLSAKIGKTLLIFHDFICQSTKVFHSYSPPPSPKPTLLFSIVSFFPPCRPSSLSIVLFSSRWYSFPLSRTFPPLSRTFFPLSCIFFPQSCFPPLSCPVFLPGVLFYNPSRTFPSQSNIFLFVVLFFSLSRTYLSRKRF